MKTTLEIPDELYRAVKAKAAMDGRRVTDLVAEGLRLLMESQQRPRVRHEFPLLKKAKSRPPLTLEDVRQVQEKMDVEEENRFGRHLRR